MDYSYVFFGEDPTAAREIVRTHMRNDAVTYAEVFKLEKRDAIVAALESVQDGPSISIQAIPTDAPQPNTL
jgi:hypothetical protein